MIFLLIDKSQFSSHLKTLVVVREGFIIFSLEKVWINPGFWTHPHAPQPFLDSSEFFKGHKKPKNAPKTPQKGNILPPSLTYDDECQWGLLCAITLL